MAILDECALAHRSKCIFLPSNRSARTKNSWAREQLSEPLPRPPNGVSLSPLVMAAWSLTLRCFIIADVTSFRCHLPAAFTCVARIDLDETVSTFVHRFTAPGNDAISSSATEDSVQPFICFVKDLAASYHQCNTAIHFYNDDGNQRATVNPTIADADLNLAIATHESNHDNSVVAFLDYDSSHTTEAMASNVLKTFECIFGQLANAHVSYSLRDIDSCSNRGQALIHQATRTLRNATYAVTLHDSILKQCRLRPSKLAVCSYDGNLTYRQLDDLTFQLAHYLVQLGAGPGTFVLSCFVKSTWAIIARLAILRAGAAYISIQAENPPIYLESVIRRTKAQILLTSADYVSQFRGVVPNIVQLDATLLANVSMPPDKLWLPKVQSSDACLVLFTSGSTGTPKGIVQTHQAYIAAIDNYARDLKLGPHTRFLHYDDYAFDISNLEFLVPLLLGGCCCVPEPIKTIDDLAYEVRALEANIAFITPTVAIRLEPDEVTCLDVLCVGGEPLPAEMVTKWKRSETQLVNQYGMGEVAVCCALNLNPEPGHGDVIGHPSTGSIWIVDPSTPEKLMPVGAIGEILIEGPHLARGYLDQVNIANSEATFISPAPHWMAKLHPQRSEARLYRSGDLGRMRNDGSIEYLGRKDMILKLDGNRIDALEVEYQARKCLSSGDTVIVDLLGVVGGVEDPRLTAFLFLDNHPMSMAPPAPRAAPELVDAVQDLHAAPLVVAIRARIAQTLPPNMIPTQFILASWIPRTASRKVDRKSLHALGQQFCRTASCRNVFTAFQF